MSILFSKNGKEKEAKGFFGIIGSILFIGVYIYFYIQNIFKLFKGNKEYIK